KPLETLARELGKELGVAIVDAELLGVVSDEAALEGTELEMQVYLVRVGGHITSRAEIAALAWVCANGEVPGTLAPAIRNHVLPQLAARRLLFERRASRRPRGAAGAKVLLRRVGSAGPRMRPSNFCRRQASPKPIGEATRLGLPDGTR